MKICWNNLEELKYNIDKDIWYKKYIKYIYMDSCKNCNESYLTYKNQIGEFCDKKCFYEYNKGENNPFYGKKHSKETKKKMSKFQRNKKISDKTKKKISKVTKGSNNPNWKGGVTKKNIPLYETYAHQIEYVEKVRNNNDILEVKCAYCGKWHIPKTSIIRIRIQALNNQTDGEHKLYCSKECKKECPIYNQKKFPKGYKKASSREVQPELRQMVFERDKYTCQKCGSIKSLHCHHIEGIRWEPLESCDIDKCITYCKQCHKEVHQLEDCGYHDMQCKESK